ncbi:Hypothetical protein A7982_00280 [Minicystis rosea]|nr:Hypothetical protein A7982_00280 [Minicystis rosea]
MIYAAFEAHRAALRAAHPSFLDAGETNLYRALPHHFPELARLADPAPGGRIHRCHLASETLDFLGLPRERWEARLGISLGVRDSLRILFAYAVATGIEILIPSDVYPVYWDLAAAAGVRRQGYEARTPSSLADVSPAADDAPQWLLVPDPVKPWGRALTEIDSIRAWAQADDRRRVLIDAVYSPRALPSSARGLIDDGIGIGLMSLSKGWLAPQKMGWALFSERDGPSLRPLFMGQQKNEAGLSFARQAFGAHADRPRLVASVIDRLRAGFLDRVAHATGIAVALPSCGYLVPDPASAAAWQERGVIAIPASVFGSSWSGSLLSVIPPAPSARDASAS